MAETVNSTPTPEAVPTPTVATPAPKSAPKPNLFLKAMGRLLTSTTWIAFGAGFIFLGILFHFKHLVPAAMQEGVARLFPHLPYLFAGLGFFCLGQARAIVLREYSAEAKKNRHFSHAWKIPLLGAQVFFLQVVACIYCLSVAFGWAQPIHGIVPLLVLFMFFIGYVLWYVIAHLKNRYPAFAAFRVSVLALVLSASSFFAWSLTQMILIGLILGFFAVITVVASLAIAPVSASGQQRLTSPRIFCLIASLFFLCLVGWNALPLGKPHADLVSLGLATKGLEGKIGSVAYSLDGHKIAFSQKTRDGWFLQIVNPENDSEKVFKIAAGEEDFRPIFVNGGAAILVDAVENGERGLWKVNALTGSVVMLQKRGVEPFGDGSPWSEKAGEFLYVTRFGDGYALRAINPSNGKSKLLMTSSLPILTPSWNFAADAVAYADGVHGVTYRWEKSDKTGVPLLSDEERADGLKAVQGDPVVEVLPAPDGFRDLYVTHKDKSTEIWAVLSNGTKRQKIYQTFSVVEKISWLPDGQKVVFEERNHQNGYLFSSTNVRLMDANLATVEDLIPRQIACHSPAPSPSGVQIAFVGSQGLWVPSGNRDGLWVAVLR